MRQPKAEFVAIIGATMLAVTILHAADASIWALAYESVGALPDYGSAMLFSLNAITCYGHTDITLINYWHLMGALEALNGCLLFGVSTAFLFGIIQKVWSVEGRDSGAPIADRVPVSQAPSQGEDAADGREIKGDAGTAEKSPRRLSLGTVAGLSHRRQDFNEDWNAARTASCVDVDL